MTVEEKQVQHDCIVFLNGFISTVTGVRDEHMAGRMRAELNEARRLLVKLGETTYGKR